MKVDPKILAAVTEEGEKNQKYQDNLFVDLLVGSFVTESRAAEVIRRLKARMLEDGVPANMRTDGKDFIGYIDKLTNLQMLNKLVQGLGLANYLDQIMTQEIQRQFPVANGSPPVSHPSIIPLSPKSPEEPPPEEPNEP